jgi:hypothetical protein
VSDTLTVEAVLLLRACRWEIRSAAALALSAARPTVAADYLRLSGSVAGLLCGPLDVQRLYGLADSVERAGDRAARRDWAELDSVDSAVALLLEAADTIERSGL